jgi:AraC-like DNA-binding protein
VECENAIVLNEADIYREWEPRPEWRHAVVCCWEQRVAADRVQRVLPDGHADVLIDGSGSMEIVGLHDEVALPRLPKGTWIRGVRLRPEAVAAAFRVTASSLRNLTVPAEDVLGSRRARQLVDARAFDSWIRSVEPNERTSVAVGLLAAYPPVEVSDVADQLGMTARQLRRILVAEIGLPPKAYQRVVRMQRFLDVASLRADLAAAAADAGYADQSHLSREVRELSGLTPAQLLDERGMRPGPD